MSKPRITLATTKPKTAKAIVAMPTNKKPLYAGPSIQDRALTYVGVSYNKAMISALLSQAHYGETRRLSAFKRELIQDPFIFGECNKVRSKLLKAPFRIITYPPSLTKPSVSGGADAKTANAISEYVRQQLSDSEVLIKKAIETLWGGMLDGVAVMEIKVEIVNGNVRLKSLTPVPQERITYIPNTMDLAIQLTDDITKLTPLADVAEHFIVFQSDETDPSPARRGILRKCIMPWFFKRYVSEFWVRHAELYGQPMRVAKYPQADDELRAKLESILRDAGNASYMAVPDSVAIDFINGATNANSALHKELIENMNESISIAILGSTQTTKIAPDAGSRASSRVHAEVASSTIEGYALQICEILREQLARRLVTYQFGPDEAYLYTPIVDMNIAGYDDLKDTAVAYQTLANSGLPIPNSFLYDTLGIPVPDPQEPCLHAVSAPSFGGSGGSPVTPVPPSPIHNPNEGKFSQSFSAETHMHDPKAAIGTMLKPYIEKAKQVKADGGDLRRVLASLNLLALANGNSKAKAEAIVQAYLVDGFMTGYSEVK